MNAVKLFKERRRKIQQEQMYYNKFIFNGHFLMFLMILFGAFILGYGEWLKDIPKGIHYALYSSIALAITSLFPIRSLLKDADKLFLLPYEKHMMQYMRQSLMYSYLMRIPLQLIVLLIIFPLFNKLQGISASFITVIVLAFIYPFLGLLIKWLWYKYGLNTWSIHILLFIIFVAGYQMTLKLNLFYGLSMVVILAGLTILLSMITKKHLFPWERMIKKEQQHHMNYYKFVNMFVDVKHLKTQAVRRRYLDPFLKVPSPSKFNSKQVYLYLFKRSFVRGKDAFHLILRLLLIAVLLIVWLNHPIVGAVIGSLSMYIIILQMSQFYTQQAYGLWPQVWPTPEMDVIEGYKKFLLRLMIVVGIILTITYSIVNLKMAFLAIIFFIVGYLTIQSTIKKLKYHETLLKD
ncbi:ABC transporter permease EcsB [Staphylococcus massiliensis]|uniref:Transporter protein n=1 Tax=Staphylococcus massiliensis S46 TaxID=1229783 RepID=K9AKG3_9STAP|nr:ABC transporter permease [Staphylococcus massiliensis]EKU46571.1 transporter protein [Staphylococcus massiliensis S46]MCG3399664.1 ABC transporter permease [Staphylococcus massiliensis]MCG3400768.1 ABC transporter permease [Staphylococcus massiliensis]MCG3412067.1 ABC transporter permease [Staphylococcus massiliensis]PNZ99060.1 multidrug ABC transporter ATP-binding protein [Staphylococcus massiliensis CCUG 55927]